MGETWINGMQGAHPAVCSQLESFVVPSRVQIAHNIYICIYIYLSTSHEMKQVFTVGFSKLVCSTTM